MMAVIEAQQAQIDAMRAELDALKAERTAAAPRPAPAPWRWQPPRRRRAAAAPVDEDDRTEAQMVAEGFTWRDQSGRSLTLSGQVNPAFNVVDDGISTDVFIVDNDTSGTRFRLDADAPLGETSLGATIEIGASPNNSYDVSQLDPQTDADFNVRRAEVTFRNDRYGRLQLGKGSSAADDTAEYDLSLVAGPIMYAGVADIAGGIIFTDGTMTDTAHCRRRLLRLRRRPAGAHPLRQPDVRSAPGLGVLWPGRPVGGGGHPRRRLRRLERMDGGRFHHACRRLGLQH